MEKLTDESVDETTEVWRRSMISWTGDPGVKISDGMMPALQRAGVMRPGQLGPMSLAPRRGRCAMTCAKTSLP